MTISIVAIDNNVVKVALNGNVKTEDVLSATDPLGAVLGDGWSHKRVVMDFSAVNAVPSAGIGWLISLNRKFEQGGGKLALHSLRPAVSDSFKFVHIDRILTLCKDEAAAVRAMEQTNGQ
jgi:anti-anti-sigma factor